ncbi:MAG TPA: hypothetical protein VI306_12215 [Pyrinomonadaceae bacterium]
MLTVRLIPALALVAALNSAALAQTNKDKELIQSARAAYYNLTRHNFNGFSATIEPDWKVILADTATAENLKVFRRQRLSMSVSGSGAVTLNQEFDEAPNASLAPSVKQIHKNVQRLLSSFFGTWSFFMIGSPFPEIETRIENLEKEQRLSYTVLTTEVRLKMTSEFLITEGLLTDPKSKRTIKPIFQKTTDGLVLTGYHTVFEPIGPGNRTTMNTVIEYADIGGMKLPARIHIKGMYGAEPVEAEFKFKDADLTKPH